MIKTLRTDSDRFGIRARLLTLLLPGILGLLALDSWNDYRELKNMVQHSYDQAMLDTVNTLRSSLSIAADGSLQLNTALLPASQQLADHSQHKYLHVGLTQVSTPQAGSPAAPLPSALTLLGEADLPAPTPSAAAGQPQPLVWYDSYYRNHPVRMVALQSQVADGHGRRFELLIQATEGKGPREQAQALVLNQQVLRDARMMLLVIVLVWLGVTWSLRPLERLRQSVQQNQGKRLQPLDTSEVPHEVAPLVEALNQHLASYQALLDQQSQFLADASHQLRTPLAIMLTQAGVALREKDVAQLHQTLRAMVAQISRSRRLCEQLLSLAHANDSTPPAEAPAVVDLGPIARDVVLQYLTLAHEKNQDLGWHDASEAVVPVLANAAELHEALANLVHNAIAYTPPGGSITVMVLMQAGMAQAEVHDDGPGIAPERRQEVFERFHHSGSTPGRGAHGAGLGLAIARAYARRNGGDIELADMASARTSGSESQTAGDGQLSKLSDPPRRGLRAILRLPLAPDDLA